MQPAALYWEEGEDGLPWVPYSEYISAQEEMLDLFQIQGPGPPLHLLLPPPPPLPGQEDGGACSQSASHFATCPSRLEVETEKLLQL
jgi:hypothetical protein